MIPKRDVVDNYYYYLNKKNVLFRKERWGIEHIYFINVSESRGYEQCVDVWKFLGITFKIRIWAWTVTDLNNKDKSSSTGFKKYSDVGKESKD